MLKIDNTLLQEVGLGVLPDGEKNSLLKHIYETLEMRVGIRLADQMSNEQLDEFERYFEAKDDAGAFKWLETNFPNYKEIVQEEFDKLKAEIKQSAPQILASSQQAQAGAALPAAQPAAMPPAVPPSPMPAPQAYQPQPEPAQPAYSPAPQPAPPYQPAAPIAPPPQPQPMPGTPPYAPTPTYAPVPPPPAPAPDPMQPPFPAQQPPAGPADPNAAIS